MCTSNFRRPTPSNRRRPRNCISAIILRDNLIHSFISTQVSKDNAPQGPSNEAENVYLDSHIYACFVDDLKAMTPQQHIRQVCKFERSVARRRNELERDAVASMASS